MSDYELIQGDCLVEMGRIADGSIDCILADLPYAVTNCHWDVLIPFAPLWAHYKRIIKPSGAIVLFGSQPFTSMLIMSNIEWFKHELIWEKDRATGFLLCNYAPLKAHENIVVFCEETVTYNPQKTTGHCVGNKSSKSSKAGRVYREYMRRQWEGSQERYPRTVQKFNTVNSAHNPAHPTQKPTELLENLILTYTNEGETVLDNTAGSFSTGVACLNTGRSFIGIEKDPEFFAIGKKRMEDAARAASGMPKQLIGTEADHVGLPLFADMNDVFSD